MEDREKQLILSRIFKKTLGIYPIDYQMNIENTPEWDSLKHLQLIAAVEKQFDIEIEFEDAIGMTSVQLIIDTIGKYVKG